MKTWKSPRAFFNQKQDYELRIKWLNKRIAELETSAKPIDELLDALRMCQPYLPTPTATADEVAETIKKYGGESCSQGS